MSRLSFHDRVVIVTGASGGLGRALALRLARQEGADVVLAARRREQLDGVAKEIAAGGRKAWPVQVDLAEPRSPSRLIEEAFALASPRIPFGLVNNAGVTHFGPFAQMTSKDIDRLVALNVRATIDLTLQFVSRLLQGSDPTRSAPPSGRSYSSGTTGGASAAGILTIASAASFVPVPYQAVYAATKHALLGFGESIAAELSPHIAVTTFAPGGIATEMVEASGINSVVGTRFLSSPESVARMAIRAWKRGRLTATGGASNVMLRVLSRLVSHRLIGRRAERFFRPDAGARG